MKTLYLSLILGALGTLALDNCGGGGSGSGSPSLLPITQSVPQATATPYCQTGCVPVTIFVTPPQYYDGIVFFGKPCLIQTVPADVLKSVSSSNSILKVTVTGHTTFSACATTFSQTAQTVAVTAQGFQKHNFVYRVY